MKKSEKLFMAINEIDDKLVDEAKGEEQKPVRIKLEKRKPIKEIVAFAACFAVIAAAMFALVKFKLSEDIDPIESNSTDSSFDSSDISDYSDQSDSEPELELRFSEEDIALQEILKELIPYTEDIDELFNYRPAAGSRYKFSYTDSYGDERSEEYYRIYDGMKSTNDLFDIPQSYDEMEKLVTRYFSRLAAESYLGNVSKTDSTNSFNGWYYDIGSTYINSFIETDGKMFFRPRDFGYLGMGIDPSTAKVKRKTDNLIEFWYWDEDISDFNGEQYADNIGVIVNENGEWKLHYFDYYGFTSAIPAEYTKEDIELQEILETLKGGDKLSNLFLPDITKLGTYYNLAFPEIPDYENGVGYIDLSSAEQYYDFPSSYEDFKQQLSQYFSREAANEFMKNVAKGTMIETADGVYSVKLTESREHPPRYIDIDGRMFYASGAGGGADINYFDTAKLIERTDNAITYSYAHSYGHGDIERIEGRLVYENGGWKRDEFYDPAANKDEFQEILSEILPAARDLDNMFHSGQVGEEELIFINDSNSNHYQNSYYPVTGDMYTHPYGKFKVPQNREELETLMSGYFTKRAVMSYMNEYSIGSATENSDGSYNVKTDKSYLTDFIEIDGQLYCCSNYYDSPLGFDIDSVNIIEYTDTVFTFSYENSTPENIGAMVYENGSWKLNHFYGYGFSAEYPAEFSAEDEELQNILNELAPGEFITSWFGGAIAREEERARFTFDRTYSFLNEPKGDYVKLTESRFVGITDNKEDYPHTCDELQQMMLKYLTEEKTTAYMKHANKGTIASGSDGEYRVKIEKPLAEAHLAPYIIEIDGELYVLVMYHTGGGSADWNSAKVISKTDDTIEFSYCMESIAYLPETGTLKFERGGWRLSDFADLSRYGFMH